MKPILLVGLCFLHIQLSAFSPDEIKSWEKRASEIEIIRDNWGIPHVYAKTDADAVFGMLYVQCEDDFARVERNYLDATGQMALAYGEDYIYHDLRARMFMDSLDAKAYYAQSPQWMKDLCDAFADGINFYLYKHPEVKADYLKRFEAWMPFTFSEGSIGGDITRIPLKGLKAFYGEGKMTYHDRRWSLEEAPTGSNGFSIAPAKSKSGSALFLINPHTSFYFRSELHINSEEGLKAYGAVTWGQFFIYQGFNEHCGWMHTSTYADAIDQYEETILKKGDKYSYQYGKEERELIEKEVSIPFTEGGQIKRKSFKLYFSHHGPIISSKGDKWISFRMMNRPLDALTQSFLRTKATGYKSFKKTMKIRTNSSNNTVYADQEGNIAYWHGNFIPKRNPDYDYNGLIDGRNPETDWGRLHKLKEMIHVRNPASGWIQNCNATPYTVAGNTSPSRSEYADYIAPDLENFRGINAVRVLSSYTSFDLEDLKAAANDPYLAFFEKTIPDLLVAYDQINMDNQEMKKAIDLLRKWDRGYGEKSVETSLAIYWAEQLRPLLMTATSRADRRKKMLDQLLIEKISAKEKIEALESAMNKLEDDFGSWNTPWGEINRFQRLTGNIKESYDDDLEKSIAVGFTSSRWGSLAAFNTTTPGTKRRYGRSGNSFVALVEFGPKVKAQTIVSGGQSNRPDSRHFKDQAKKFCKGEFKTAYYYKEDVLANAEKTYKPGK